MLRLRIQTHRRTLNRYTLYWHSPGKGFQGVLGYVLTTSRKSARRQFRRIVGWDKKCKLGRTKNVEGVADKPIIWPVHISYQDHFPLGKPKSRPPKLF